MPLNARWGRSKIVAPLNPSREAEIAGGLKNALERGEPLAKAKQSFLNAGYKPEEIAAAVQKIPAANSQIKNTVRDSREDETSAKTQATYSLSEQETQPLVKPKTQPSPTTTTKVPGQPQKLSKKFIIILISSGALVLVGAALLGIFWDKLF